jgi:S-adenosylmethionine synthetase
VKNIVAAGLAKRAELQVAYAIGEPAPVAYYVETFGTNSVPEEKIAQAVEQVFDFSPQNIIEELDLLRPIYSKTAAYGHFGRELEEFTWEKINRVDQLLEAVHG